MKKLLIALTILLASAIWSSAWAGTTYYMATDGSDVNNGSSGAEWATFAHAFDVMVSGDDLVVRDGTYNQKIGPTSGTVQPPSGESFDYTKISAENDFGATIKRIYLYGVHYVEVRGFRVIGNETQEVGYMSASDHCKFINCGFVGAITADINSHAVVISGSYNLMEDCYVWGGGRYQIHSPGGSHHNIFRRCVARYDYRDDTGSVLSQQCANFTRYDIEHVEWQNCIAIDSNYAYAVGFWNENNSPDVYSDSGKMLGCIVLNLAATGNYGGAVNDSKFTVGPRTVKNTIIWDCSTGYRGGWGTQTIDHNTFGEINGPNPDSSHIYYSTAFANSHGTVTNNLYLNSGYAFSTSVASLTPPRVEHSVIYGNTAIQYAHSIPIDDTLSATNSINNPSLKYLPDASRGSSVPDGNDGIARGATIMYEYGRSGTLWGEPGYEELTTTQIWPWPNEAQIRSDMRSYTAHGVDGTRGFCADGQTLTKYIWEYLGNTIPEEIYGAPGANLPPVASASADVTTGDAPLTVTFNGGGTDSDGTIAGYSWDFGDGVGTSSSEDPSYEYTTAGTYTAVLTVTDDDADTDTASVDINVTIPSGSSGNDTFYVATTGSDSNAGSSGSPWLTLQKAADQIVAGNIVAGDTISVAAGTYAGFNIWDTTTNTDTITFLASGTVILNDENASTDDIVNIENIDYITLDGFEVTGAATGEGVRVVKSNYSVVQNCTVHDNGDRNIFFAFAPHAQILNNTCYNAAQEHGIYYSNSDGPAPVFDAPIIRGNTVYGNYQNGIQINGDLNTAGDGNIEQALIEDNVVYNNGWKGMSFISMSDSLVQNNLIYQNATRQSTAGGIHLADEPGTSIYSTGNVIVNNTIVEDNQEGIQFNSGSGGNWCWNNIVASLSTADGIIVDNDGGNHINSNNLQTRSVSGLFTDYPNDDFTLAGGSAAIDTGSASYLTELAPPDDIDGNTRPQGSADDLGAYEYTSGVVVQDYYASGLQAQTLDAYITLTTGSNRRVMVAATIEDNDMATPAAVSCQLDGTAMTQTETSTATSSGLYIHALAFDMTDAALPAGAGTYLVRLTMPYAVNEVTLIAYQFDDIDQGDLTANTTTNSAVTTAYTLASEITTTADGSTVVSVLGDGQPSNVTADNGQTIVKEVDADSSTGIMAYKVVTTAGADADGYSTLSGYRRAMLNIELPAYSTGGGGDVTAPAAINDASIELTRLADTVIVSFTERGDDGTDGTATSFDLRYKSGTWDWATATAATGEPTPLGNGTAVRFTLSGLTADTAYTLAIKSDDEVPNTSAVSNLVTFTTRAADVRVTGHINGGVIGAGGV